MRMSIGADIGPFRVSQTIARTRGGKRGPNTVGVVIQAILLSVVYTTVWSIRLSIRVGAVLLNACLSRVR